MYNKAIAALITPVVVGFLAPLGITAETSLATLIEIIVVALSTAAMVYFVPNKV